MKEQKSDIPVKGYEYDTLMNMLHVSVSKHLLDEHFTMVWANDFYYETIGYPKEEYEALFHNRPDLYYAEEPRLWNELVGAVMQAIGEGRNGYSIVTRMRRKGGEYRWIQIAATFVDEYIDGYQVAYSVMTDVDDVMRIKQEQSVTYDNLPGFVAKYKVEKDLHFTLIEANGRFLDFFGKDSWKNEEYSVSRENVERNIKAFEAHREELLAGEPVHFMVNMRSCSGKEAWLQINADCVDWQGGDPVYLVIYIDVTDETELREMQKKLERQAEELRCALRQAEEASRAKSDFFSRMSHDIRTPMNAILGMRDIALAHLDDGEKVRDCLKKIGLSGQHLLGLINDVLDMSKIENGEMVLRSDTVSLPEELENIVTIMQPQFKQKDQKFSIRLKEVVHEQFLSDALRLRQIFLNILSNAYKFTPCGGSITMDVRETVSGQPDVALFTFAITDTGVGMQPEFLTHIFDAFSRERDSRTDKTEGTGLGMAITEKLVELLNGKIEVQSRPQKGTVFCVTLPLKIEEASPCGGTFPNLRVIVADDDVVMCEYTVEMLRHLGIYADWVDCGEKMIQEVREAKRRGEAYDAVVLDWKMPGQDGLQTARRIRRICGEVPILIISAYDWSDIEKEAQDVGVSGFLTKPVFASTLCSGLRKHVLGETADGPETKGAGPQRNFSGKRFLLVEDNLLNQEVAVDLLTDAGAEVDIACDGAEGVRVFAGSAEGTYDMVLMDIQMPVMDGYTAAEKIRALGREDAREVPILAMTADAFAEDIAAAKAAEMDGHLAKPLDERTLKREIGKYLLKK